MDLTEIMEFIDDLNESPENNSPYICVQPGDDLSPQQRCRANTWHGDRPPKLENIERTTPPVNNETIFEDCNEDDMQESDKSQGKDQSLSVAFRKSISRRNAWGNLSYADIITKAINSTPDKRMTLSEIYNWMVQNIPFFKDKGDTNSSAGWKNSIRHNLSLHSCFMRVQNEGTGKSSWWMLNPEYRASKMPRRRAATMDIAKASNLHSNRKLKTNKKLELLRMAVTETGSKKNNNGSHSLKSNSSSSDLRYLDPSFINQVNSSDDYFNLQDFRPRSSSNACPKIKLMTTYESDDQDDQDLLPPPPPPSVTSSFSDRQFQWAVSEVFEDNYEHDIEQNDDSIMKMLNCANKSGMSPNTVTGVPISIQNMGPAFRDLSGGGVHPSSLPVSSNMKIYSKSDSHNNEDIKNFKPFLDSTNNYIEISPIGRPNESFLLTGGGLVRSFSGNLQTGNSVVATDLKSNPVDKNNNLCNKKKTDNPILREYLSQDDFSPSSYSEPNYQPKLVMDNNYNNQSLNAKNGTNHNQALPDKSLFWQQQGQQNNLSTNHGLLLHLLTEKSQQNLQQQQLQQYLENLSPRASNQSNNNNNNHPNTYLQQQQQQYKNDNNNNNNASDLLHLSSHHPSMLRHLLTAGQRGHKNSFLGNPHHHQHQHFSETTQHSSSLKTQNQNSTLIRQQQQQQPMDTTPQQNSINSRQTNLLHTHQMQQYQQQQQQQQTTPLSIPILISPNSNFQFNNQFFPQESKETDRLTDDMMLPSDLDFSLLDLDSSEDIECNIDLVIDHEKKFGDALDFNFDEDFMFLDGVAQETIK